MDKVTASEFLLQTLQCYKDKPFDELVQEIGTGDYYQIISEGIDGSTASYTVSIEIDWEDERTKSVTVSAELHGPDPVGGGALPFLQRETIVI